MPQSGSQIFMALGIAWIDLESLFELIDRVREASRMCHCEPQTFMALGIAGINLQSLLELLDRFREASRLFQSDPQIVMSVGSPGLIFKPRSICSIASEKWPLCSSANPRLLWATQVPGLRLSV